MLSGQGPSPFRATVDYYRSKQLDSIPTGPGTDAPKAFTIPGVVGATFSMLQKYGTLKVEDVLESAIEYAIDGFPNYEYMLNRLKSVETKEQFKLFPPGGIEIFFDQGQVPEPGTLLRQIALGNTLKKIVGKDFIIKASVGHLKDLPKKKLGVDVDALALAVDHDGGQPLGQLVERLVAKRLALLELPNRVQCLGVVALGQVIDADKVRLQHGLGLCANQTKRCQDGCQGYGQNSFHGGHSLPENTGLNQPQTMLKPLLAVPSACGTRARAVRWPHRRPQFARAWDQTPARGQCAWLCCHCLLYTSDAADE